MTDEISLMIDLSALATSCIALVFTARLRSTYFMGSRFFIALANLAFVAILLQSSAVDAGLLLDSRAFYYGMISISVMSVGFASYLMRSNVLSGVRNLTGFLSRPPKQFEAFMLIVAAWTLIALALTSDGSSPIFLVASAILLASFLALPVMTFYRQSFGTRDPKASTSIKAISIAWALFGIVAFTQAALAPNPTSFAIVRSATQLSDGLLFIVITIALTEPTVLSRMIVGSGQTERGLYFGGTRTSVVLYDMESDRKRIIDEFLNTRTSNDEPLVCYVSKSEIPFYRAVFQDSHAQDPGRDSNVIVRAVESSMSESIPDQELSNSRRELVDLGDLDLTVSRRFVEERRRLDQMGRAPRNRVWAISLDASKKEILDEIIKLNPTGEVIDLVANQNVFSEKLGITHQSLLGARILLEYEPQTDYERIVKGFASEFVSNVQPVAVFSSLGGPVFRQLQRERKVRLFMFSSKISTPSKIGEGHVLLPERDTSLLIDAVDKLVQAHKGRQLGLVVDGFTDLILSQGFEKSYGVLSSVLEMAEVGTSTVLILINSTCLDEMTTQGLRGLFKYNLQFTSTGLRVIRSPQTGRSSSRGPSTHIEDEESKAWSVAS